MLKRVALVFAVLALIPSAAMADGVEFGFFGGAVGAVPSGSAFAISTSAVGAVSPTLGFVARLPNPPGPAFGGGVNLGTIAFTTGTYTSSSGSTNYFGLGGSFVITGNAAFSAITGGQVAANSTLFSGSFTDITTSVTLGSLVVPSGTPGGTGALWRSIACPQSQINLGAIGCSQLIGSIGGTLNPSLISWLGLGNTNFANGWVAELSFTSNGSIYNVTFGDASLYVPEPGTLMLFGTGLASIAGVIRRKFAA